MNFVARFANYWKQRFFVILVLGGALLALQLAVISPVLAQTSKGHSDLSNPKLTYFNPFDIGWADGRWWVSAYAGIIASNNTSLIFGQGRPDTRGTHSVALTVGREFGSFWGGDLRAEWEIGVARKFGDESLYDFRALLALRWTDFPWNYAIRTTAAFGMGPSRLSKQSKLYEAEDGKSALLKNALLFEVTMALPDHADWVLVLRLDHRSGVFGLQHPTGTPSDYLNIGIKHRF